MDYDLIFVIGVVIAVFSIPSILGALLEGRAPRAGAIAVVIAGGMILFATTQSPEGYALGEIPELFVAIVARYIN